jgi:hypothetical protein
MEDDRKDEPSGEPPLWVPDDDSAWMNAARAHHVRQQHNRAAILATLGFNQVVWPLPAYPRYLMTVAQDLIEQGQFSIAVVVAHMACEVATEEKLSKAFTEKGLQYLKEPVIAFLNGYNLATQRIRNLYVALTGDEVHNAPFWSQFTESATRRNGIIHKGLTVDKSAAEKSYKAVADLLTHLGM